MPISIRAAALRAALERATGEVATVSSANGRVRITASIPSSLTIAAFRQALQAARSGDDWGGSGADGLVVLWAEITEEGS